MIRDQSESSKVSQSQSFSAQTEVLVEYSAQYLFYVPAAAQQ
jgi:hypothetical protein